MLRPSSALYGIGAGVILVGAGFVGGRYLSPTRVEERERIIEQTVAANTSSDATRSAEGAVHDVGTRLVVRYVERPDGTRERTETRSAMDHSAATSARERVVTKTEIRYQDRIVEKERIVTRESRARWAVDGGARVGLGHLAPVYQLGISRRIIGPVWVGIQGSSDKQIGAYARWEF